MKALQRCFLRSLKVSRSGVGNRANIEFV